MGIGLFFQATSGRLRGNVLKLLQGRFRLDTTEKNNNNKKKSAQALEQAAKSMVESPSLEMFLKKVEMVFRNMV